MRKLLLLLSLLAQLVNPLFAQSTAKTTQTKPNVLFTADVNDGGEITDAWDLIEVHVREALRERALTSDLGRGQDTDRTGVSEHPRLRGAVALVTAPVFAAPKVAYKFSTG